MIFAGDVAIAKDDVFAFVGFDDRLRALPWSFNLEGAILDKATQAPEWGVYNSPDVLKQLAHFGLGPLFLGNNHIHDLIGGLESTLAHLQSRGLHWYGAGHDRGSAGAAAVMRSGSHRYRLLGFGWHVIGSRVATRTSAGVNRFDYGNVMALVRRELAAYSNDRLIVVIHGNYESEIYLQPGHRSLARSVIDQGAHAVVFHHPHVVGPIEHYRGRLIAHSLGNWAFSNARFFGGRLRMSAASFQLCAIEFGDAEPTVHHARFEPPGVIRYVRAERLDAAGFTLRPEFEGLDDADYMAWFRRNRTMKIGLPIYTSAKTNVQTFCYDSWVYLRQQIILGLLRLGLKTCGPSTTTLAQLESTRTSSSLIGRLQMGQ